MTLRSHEDLRASLADVLDEQAQAPDEYYRGCAAALEWVTRKRSTPPVGGEVSQRADETTMNAELAAVIAMLHGERAIPSTLRRGYLSGVEATLAWVIGQTEEPPLQDS